MAVDNSLFSVKANYKVEEYKDLAGCADAVLAALRGLINYNTRWIDLASKHKEGSVPHTICCELKCKEKVSAYTVWITDISKIYAVYRNSIGNAEKKQGLLLCDVISTVCKQIFSSNDLSCATYAQVFTRCSDTFKNIEKYYSKNKNEEGFQAKWEGVLVQEKIPDRFHIPVKSMTEELLYNLKENFFGALNFMDNSCGGLFFDTMKLFKSAIEYSKVTKNDLRIELADGNITVVEMDKLERKVDKVPVTVPKFKGGIAALVKIKANSEKSAKELKKKIDSDTKKLQAEQDKPEKKKSQEKIEKYSLAIEANNDELVKKKRHVQKIIDEITQQKIGVSALSALKAELNNKKYDSRKIAKRKKDIMGRINDGIKAYKGK